jgi:sec-independent protein translocase protein TatC
MFITPPDVLSQTLVAIPMYLLYEAGIIMARVLLPVGVVDAESGSVASTRADT